MAAGSVAGACKRRDLGVGPRLSCTCGIRGQRNDSGGCGDHRGSHTMSAKRGASYTAARIAARIASLGREITRAYKERRVDAVITLDRGFVFAADLIREIGAPGLSFRA